MQSTLRLCAVAITIIFGASVANADTYRFEATSSEYGFLGYLDYDSSAFTAGSTAELVLNPQLLDLSFTNPFNAYSITTIGPPDNGTYFNTVGLLPFVDGGDGFTGGNAADNGVFIVGATEVLVGEGSGHFTFTDVTWSTVDLSAGATPLPAALPLFATGIGGLGLLGWRRKRRAQAVA